jgi:hypothetical protein
MNNHERSSSLFLTHKITFKRAKLIIITTTSAAAAEANKKIKTVTDTEGFLRDNIQTAAPATIVQYTDNERF